MKQGFAFEFGCRWWNPNGCPFAYEGIFITELRKQIKTVAT
jgi:hypothetical protein